MATMPLDLPPVDQRACHAGESRRMRKLVDGVHAQAVSHVELREPFHASFSYQFAISEG